MIGGGRHLDRNRAPRVVDDEVRLSTTVPPVLQANTSMILQPVFDPDAGGL